MTKGQAVELLSIKSFDYAIPESFNGRSALIEYNEANGTAYDTEVKVLDI